MSGMRRVRFFHVVTVYCIDDVDEDRRGEWMQASIDRCRFQRRIEQLSDILSPVLTEEHRQRIVLRNVLINDTVY
jgi:hypothetical protein